MDIKQYPNNCPLMYIYIENELGEEQCRETTCTATVEERIH